MDDSRPEGLFPLHNYRRFPKLSFSSFSLGTRFIISLLFTNPTDRFLMQVH